MHQVAEEVRAAVHDLAPPTRVHTAGDVAQTLAAMLPPLAEEPSPDLTAPPFHYDPDRPAAAAGQAIADAYARMAPHAAPSLPAIIAAACDRAGAGPACAERRAAMVAAVLASVPSRNAYHNANHTREVVIGAIWLANANAALARNQMPGAVALDATQLARLLLLATLHDIGHDGTSNVITDRRGRRRRTPHRLEDQSFRLMEPVLRRAGLVDAVIETLRATIRATDVALRPAARSITDHILFGRPETAPRPAILAPLAASPQAAAVAALLADADILSSAALTREYQRAQNTRLTQEVGADFSRADVLAFFDVIVGGEPASAAGRLLGENLRRIRAAVAADDN